MICYESNYIILVGYVQNGRKKQLLKLIEKWKEIVISKLLFPSTLLFLGKTKKKWNKMEGNSNFKIQYKSGRK